MHVSLPNFKVTHYRQSTQDGNYHRKDRSGAGHMALSRLRCLRGRLPVVRYGRAIFADDEYFTNVAGNDVTHPAGTRRARNGSTALTSFRHDSQPCAALAKKCSSGTHSLNYLS